MVSEEIISRQYESAKLKYPKLIQLERVGEIWEINGSIDVIDDEGGYWDTYEVKIVVPKKYPEEIFELHETGEKIKKEASWHNFKYCCLSTNAIIYSVLGDDLTLLNWLDKFAHPFLANHIVKKKTGNYAAGEFRHDTAGIIQGYEKLFAIEGQNSVFIKLKELCCVLKSGRNDPCFCENGKKFKNCFLVSPFTHKILNIPYTILEKDYQEINTYITRKRKK